MTMKERLPRILEISLRLLPQIRANADDGDSTGVSLASLMGNLRDIGVADFVLSANIAKFKECLSDAAKVRLRLFERHVNGEPIAASLVAMLSYQEVFDALAARDFGTAEKLATLMGGRPGLEKEHDHPFDYCLGYTLKSFVERDESAMVEWAGKFEDLCRTKGNGDFAGYAQVFKAILARDNSAAQSGLEEVVKGHVKQCKRGGVFKDNVDETLCVWGVGIANLCRRYGLSVNGIPPLIPGELLV